MSQARPRILLIGNYAADQLQSMERYAGLLVRIYQPEAEVELLRPPAMVGALPGLPAFIRKYLAYIDKLILFPAWLALRVCRFDRVHISDHGNAFYSFCCRRRQSIVTCHDLLAMRAAFGDASTACKPSSIGIWLQRLILAGLKHAGAVVFVSDATRQDCLRLVGQPARQRQVVIPNALNAPFGPDLQAFPLTPYEAEQVPAAPFLLMVGSSHPRKNRFLALDLLSRLGSGGRYRVVFAGAALTPAEQSFCDTHPLGDRLISIVRPSHALLNRLYCKAHALLFPSIAEGFGWPLIEAQACGCPVIASTTTSIPEVAGIGALYADPEAVVAFEQHVTALEDHAQRARLIQLGFENIRRYEPELIQQQMLAFAFSGLTSALTQVA
jgi:glycosyltransferase involved in cell wall biosynthesis